MKGGRGALGSGWGEGRSVEDGEMEREEEGEGVGGEEDGEMERV